jgi:hypothetical protein
MGVEPVAGLAKCGSKWATTVPLSPPVDADEDDEPDADGSALAGAALFNTAPPTAASPNVTRAAVLAIRALIM